jgi:hypothetical protein
LANMALYFPYMRLPQDSWFSRVLLYWDKVGTIVPYEVGRRPEVLGTYTAELIKADFVIPISPQEYVPDFDRFRQGFVEVIDSDGPLIQRLQRNEGEALVGPADVDAVTTMFLSQRSPSIWAVKDPQPRGMSLIHVEKMGLALADELENRGLAQPARFYGRESWYLVEERTASLFMAYLALVLGHVDRLGMDPITDSRASLTALGVPTRRSATRFGESGTIQLEVLDGILPAPAAAVPLDELKKFKHDNRILLSEFRERIVDEVLAITSDPDEAARTQRIRFLHQRLQREIKEVSDRMHSRRWPRIVLGGFCGAAAATVPVGVAAATANPLPLVLAVPGLVHAVYIAVGEIKRKREVSPLAYAVYARKRYGEGRGSRGRNWLLFPRQP